jgi:uncharacterized membrane protein
MFLGVLFGMLFFVPLLGMAIRAGLGVLTGPVTKMRLSSQLEQQAQDLVQPGASAAFMILKQGPGGPHDRSVEQVRRHGSEVLVAHRRREGIPGGPARSRAARRWGDRRRAIVALAAPRISAAGDRR